MKLKKIYCYILLLVLLINAPLSVNAQATSIIPTVTIAAGTGAAVGGAYLGFTTKTAAAATALTLAVLSATGAAVKLTEASVQAGKTVYQVINDKFAQWVGGTSAEELSPTEAEELQSRFKVITGGGGNSKDPDDNQNNGTNIGEDGKLWFSPGSLAMLKQFCDFLESSNSINDLQGSNNDPMDFGPYSTVMSTGVGIGNASTNFYHVSIRCNKKVAVFVDNANYYNDHKHRYCFAISNEPFVSSNASVNGNSIYYHGYYYLSAGPVSNGGYDYVPAGALNTYYTVTEIIDKIIAWKESVEDVQEDGIYKGENYNSDILKNPNNQILVIDPGILNGFNVDSDRQIAIPDYIDLIIQQAEQKAKNDAQQDPSPAPQELPVPLIDPIAGTKSPANWIDPSPEDAIQDPAESEKRDPDPEDPKDPVIDHDTPTDPEDAVELLKVDLTRIFPFCIPWDLYRLLTKFNAEPVTPSITIDWGDILGTFGIDYVTTLDLHDYDNVASILRTMETVAFVVGLAVATRSIFLRS